MTPRIQMMAVNLNRMKAALSFHEGEDYPSPIIQPSDDDGEPKIPDHSQILEALLTAGDGDIDQDVFRNH